jgi:hypothetical protein
MHISKIVLSEQAVATLALASPLSFLRVEVWRSGGVGAGIGAALSTKTEACLQCVQAISFATEMRALR